jgi:hypothetical protein
MPRLPAAVTSALLVVATILAGILVIAVSAGSDMI